MIVNRRGDAPHKFRTARIGRAPGRPGGATGGASTPEMQIPTRQARRLMFDDRVSLDSLYAWLDAIKEGRATGDGWGAHVAVLDRLAANRRVAEAHGWTSCALEGQGAGGRLRLWGGGGTGGGRGIV